MRKEELLGKLTQKIVDCDDKASAEVAQEIITAGIDPLDAIQRARQGLDIIGERFQRLEAYIPELVKAGDAMKACMAVLTPYISPENKGSAMQGKVVIGTVSGDVHDIGKNMVSSMLTAAGFEVDDLGIDVPDKQFIEKAEELGAKVIAMSALLTMTAYRQAEIIKRLKDTGLRGKYYVIVGGGPISAEWARKIGADGYGATAINAVQLAKRLLDEGTPPPLPQPVVIQ